MDFFLELYWKVEDLNINEDMIEKENVTNHVPSPDVPLLKVSRRVKFSGIVGRKVRIVGKLNVHVKCRDYSWNSALHSQYISRVTPFLAIPV